MKNNRHFIIVGGQRCGSTLLYKFLTLQPDIQMIEPVKPEPKFFLNKNVSYGDYTKLFNNRCQGSLIGEKSTSYYEDELVPQRISSLIPTCKIIFILRNPIDRAISNYNFSVQNGLENRTLSEVFLQDKPKPKTSLKHISVDPFDYIGRGLYYNFIENYKRFFPASQISVITLESFISKKETRDEIINFLGVSPMPKDICFSPDEKVNGAFSLSKEDISLPLIRHTLADIYRDSIKKLEGLIDVKVWEDFRGKLN